MYLICPPKFIRCIMGNVDLAYDDSVFNYFIMKDYAVKTTRSRRAEWNSRNILYSLRKGFKVVYLFDCTKTREPWTNCQGGQIQRNEKYHTDKEKSFLWIEALSANKFYNLQIFLSFRILSNRIQAYPLLPRTQTSCERVMRKFMWL